MSKMLDNIHRCRLALCKLRNKNAGHRITCILIARPCVPGGWSSGTQRRRILEGWIGEMANDDHVEGMVAQTRDDVSVTTGSGQHVSRGPCDQPYRLVSYLFYFTTII
jgi:hypothetical protein